MQTLLNPARDPLGRTAVAEHVGQYAPLGITLNLQTNSIRLLQTAEAAFGRYGPAGAGAPEISIRILVEDTFSAAPPWPAPVVRGHGDLLYIAAGSENVIVADLARRHAFGFLSPAMAEDTSTLRTSFLECAVFAIATHGTGATRSYVHASAVARGDSAFVFSGPCESGKSTLAYACGRRGFRIVTDDVLYLRSDAGDLTAWGRPWRLRFLADCTRLFPELDCSSALLTPENEIEIEVEDLLPGGTQLCCRPSALFFLNRCGTSPRMERITADDAVTLLARDLIADLPAVTEKHCRAWRLLAEQGSYILHYGHDPASVVDLLERFHRGSD
jgi:hypothetical protein